MNTRTVGWPSAPATSAWTSSTPWSMAACSAISRTRSATDLESISVPQVAQLALLSPKRKVGRNPPGNAIEDSRKFGVNRSGSSGSKRGSIKFPGSTNCIGEHQKKEPGADTPGLSSGLRLRSVLLEQFLRPGPRANHGDIPGPVIATKDTHQFALFVVNRTA